MNKLQARWRACALAAISLICAAVFGWQAADTTALSAWLQAALFCVPALAPAMGLWRGKRYTYRWATLCVLPYFLIGVTESFANPAARPWSSVLLGASLFWFVSLIGYLRVSSDKSN